MIELDAFSLKPIAKSMRAFCQKQRIAPLIVIEPVKSRQPNITTNVASHAPDCNEAHRFARHKQRRLGKLNRAYALGLLCRTIEPNACSVEQCRRQRMLLFDSDVLIA